MRVFEFSADGKAMSATVVVVAKTMKVAKRLAVEWCGRNKVDSATLHELNPSQEVKVPFIAHACDGDY